MNVFLCCALSAFVGAIVGGTMFVSIVYKNGFEDGYDEAVRAMDNELKKGLAK